MAATRIARTVVHHGLNDPQTTTGGVETFARNLQLAFDEVLFMTPDTIDVELVRRRKLPVICDNHHVLDWPDDVPLIGFQHGVAARKMFSIPHRATMKMAQQQRKAARRKRTVWVACAQWISRMFAKLHGNPASHIVYHSVDLERFDGKLNNEGSKLLLHDGRTEHKGCKLFPQLVEALPEWRFEALNCKPDEVPDRMRRARAFIHLSRYEGNSIVCNEAMAMNLPCLFTKAGLMLDDDPGIDVDIMPVKTAFGGGSKLVRRVETFLNGLENRSYEPRRWVTEHASLDDNRRSWSAVMDSFDELGAWE